jgi:hypothetical protein
MTLTTDDLRHALADAADDPYPSVRRARLDDVRARVRTIRRRRAAVATAASGIAIVAVAASFGLGHGSPKVSPAPATSPRPSVVPLPAMPALWGVRDVVGQVSGSGWQTPSTRLHWPSGTTGILVHCTGTDRAVQVDVRPATGVASRTSVPCQGTAGAWREADLPPAATSIEPGTDVIVQGQLDDPEATTTFSVALLVGKNLIDGSLLATPQPGYARIASFALADGFFYNWTGDGVDPSTVAAGSAPNSAHVLIESRGEVQLRIRCSGKSTVEVTGDDGQRLGSIACPAGERVMRELNLSEPPSDGRLTVRLADADPGSLVQVGVSTR